MLGPGRTVLLTSKEDWTRSREKGTVSPGCGMMLSRVKKVAPHHNLGFVGSWLLRVRLVRDALHAILFQGRSNHSWYPQLPKSPGGETQG